MADTNGIGRHRFQVKTDVRESGIKQTLDKMYNEEFKKVSFTSQGSSTRMRSSKLIITDLWKRALQKVTQGSQQ